MPIADTISTRTSQLDAESEAVKSRQAALDAKQQAGAAAYEREAAPIEKTLSAEMAQPLPTPPQATATMAPPDVSKIVDRKQYEGLSFALLGMALIGGAVSHGNWLAAGELLNGALKGYKEGNEEKAKEMLADYQRKFEAARAHDEAANREYQRILDDRKLTINQQLEMLKVVATKHQRQDVAAAAEQRSIDAVTRQIEAGRTQLANTEQRHEDLQASLAVRRQMHAASQASGVALTPEGEQFVTQAYMAGNKELMTMVGSRFGQHMLVPIINDMARQRLDPRDITANEIMVKAQASAERFAVMRLQGVERLTNSLQPLEARVQQLTAALNGRGIPLTNKVSNTVRQALGDGPLQELTTLMGSVGRQYLEAITAPASNAQLHATAQEWAQGILNPNMSFDQLQGTLRAMNAEITSTRNALHEQMREPGATVKGLGPAAPSGASAPSGGKVLDFSQLPKG